MKKFLEKKWLTLVYGFLLVAVGALTLTYAIIDPSVVTKVLSISIAVSLFLIGAANIVLALVAHTSDFFHTSLLTGSAAIAFGVLFCINTLLIGEFIAYLLGVFFIAFAVVSLIKFILFIVYKQNLAWIIIYGIVFAISAAAGIIILCFKEQTNQVLYGIIGSFIALAGLFEIVASTRMIILAKREQKQRQANQPIDADVIQDEPVKKEEGPVVEVEPQTIETNDPEQIAYKEEDKDSEE